MPLFCTAAPFKVMNLNRRKSAVSMNGAGSACRRTRCKWHNRSSCRPRFRSGRIGRPHAVALGRSDREQHAFGQTRIRRELHFVIRLSQHQGFSGHRFGFFATRLVLFHGETQAAAQFFQRERVSRPWTTCRLKSPARPSSWSFARTGASRTTHLGTCTVQAVTGGSVDHDVAIRVEESGAKRDRGDMAFPVARRLRMKRSEPVGRSD